MLKINDTFVRLYRFSVDRHISGGDWWRGLYTYDAGGRGADLEEVLRMGVACGTAAIMNPGTTLCKPEDVASIHNDIQLLPLGSF